MANLNITDKDIKMDCGQSNSCDMNMDCMKCDKANCTLRKYDYDKMGMDVDLMERVRLKKLIETICILSHLHFPKVIF